MTRTGAPEDKPTSKETDFAVDVLCVGHASYDLTMRVERHPGPDEKCFATGMIGSGGGPAANAGVTVARLGGNAAFAGYLGEDEFGRRHFDELLSEGVRTELVVRGSFPTPLSIVIVKPDGSRTIVTNKSDTPFLKPHSVDFTSWRPNVILFDGHEPLISLPLAEKARRMGIGIVLDAGSVHRGTMELAPISDYLVASERFARDFSGESDPEKALERMSRPDRMTVITLGAEGLVWAGPKGHGRLPAFPVEAADTTGAGDTFHGAFSYGIAKGMDLPDLLIYASAAAALCCGRIGARPGIPFRSELESFLRERDSFVSRLRA